MLGLQKCHKKCLKGAKKKTPTSNWESHEMQETVRNRKVYDLDV